MREASDENGTRASAEHVAALSRLLAERWPDATVELDHQNAYQLLVATILAAQSTDKMINTITPALFERYPDASTLAQAEPAEVEPLIFKSGFYRMKAKHLVEMARAVVANHGGEVPATMDALVALPGVARKTANVVLGCALGKNEGVIVDTHVIRVSNRLGLTTQTDPAKIETDLMAVVPREDWTKFANRMIWHGRYICQAKTPLCDQCALAPVCPSAALFVGGAKPVPRSKSKSKSTAKSKSAAKPAATPSPHTAPGVVKRAKQAVKAAAGKAKAKVHKVARRVAAATE